MKAKELEKLAIQQGFKFKKQKGSHKHYIHGDGRRTTISMHGGDVPIGTTNQILKDIGYKKKQSDNRPEREL